MSKIRKGKRRAFFQYIMAVAFTNAKPAQPTVCQKFSGMSSEFFIIIIKI